MTAIDPIPLLRLSRAAADLGHYNLAKLLNGTVAASRNREWFAASLPKTDPALVDALEAIEPQLHAAAVDRSLIDKIEHARSLTAANQIVLYPDAPPLYVCRVCGEV